jgi:predicted permease
VRWPFGRRRDEELDEEIDTHLAIEAQQRVGAGETPDAAARGARRAFGSVMRYRDATRDEWRWRSADAWRQDLKYAIRTMRRSPRFAAIVIATLALGIGANTAIFSLVNAILLQPLPFPDADRLVRIQATKNGAWLGAPSPPAVLDFRRLTHSFDGLVIYDAWRKNVSSMAGMSDPEQMAVGLVPPEYFHVLGLAPIMGRLFTQDEQTYGRHYVAAISETLWRLRWGRDPAILGQTVRINDEPYTIVAVMPDVIPQWMHGRNPVHIWTPFAFDRNVWSDANRADHGNAVIGRLRADLPLAQAQADLERAARTIAADNPIDHDVGATLEPLANGRVGPLRPFLLMLVGAVAFVLLIACANVANLLLARHTVRRRELVVRVALGAGRVRLVRQLLIECALLAIAAAAVGIFVARVSLALLQRWRPAHLPQLASIVIDARVFVFAGLLALASVLLFGLVPALSGTRVDLVEALTDGGRTGTAGAATHRWRQALAIGEVALSLMLLIATTLLVRTIINLERQPSGFRPDHLLKAHFYLPPVRYTNAAALTQFCDQLSDRVRPLPGVRQASITTIFPPWIQWGISFTIDGRPVPRIEDAPSARFGVTDAAYVGTMGITLIAGRDFGDTDREGHPPVALVNQAFVHRYFPNEEPIGRRLRLGMPTHFGDATIVGVVADFMNDGRNDGHAHAAMPQIITLYRQQPAQNYGFKDIVIRTDGDPEMLAGALRAQLKALDSNLPLAEVETLETVMAKQTTDDRFTTFVLAAFAVLGTILTLIGIYSVLSYVVTQRRQEISVRTALGAAPGDILWLVVRQGVVIAGFGVLLGLIGAATTRHVLAGLMFGVSPTDPATFAAVGAGIAGVALIACLLPAVRAARLDPSRGLRAD